MITVKEAIRIQKILIEEFGGAISPLLNGIE
jgi:hypothetical protein